MSTLNMSKTTLFCPHCELMMKDHSDAEAVAEFGCCHDCKLHFVDPDKVSWHAGSRPSASKVSDRIKRRNQFRVKHYKLAA